MSSGKILKCSCGRLNELDGCEMAICTCGAKHKYIDSNCICGSFHEFVAKSDWKDLTLAETGDDPSIVDFVFDDSTTLPVVKQFLCQESPVFMEMLSNVNFKESSQNKIKLPAGLLQDDGSGRNPEVDPNIFQLQMKMFEYAVEYQMDKLMNNFIKNFVNKENVLSMIPFAISGVGYSKLLEHCKTIFRNNESMITRQLKWKQISIETLTCIMDFYANNNHQSIIMAIIDWEESNRNVVNEKEMATIYRKINLDNVRILQLPGMMPSMLGCYSLQSMARILSWICKCKKAQCNI